MNDTTFVGIIPARYASSRFPGKPLAMIGDKSVIERVWRQAVQALDEVFIATDDLRIAEAVEKFGGKVIMTQTEHKSGTDRCYEAFIKSKSKANVIINIQSDEPFIHTCQIQAVKELFADKEVQIGTIVRKFDKRKGIKALQDITEPKVILDNNHYALYFSRSVIPFVRGKEESEWPDNTDYYTHIGMYAYRADVLAEITQLPRSPLERAESLEQLRWLQNGYKIKVAFTDKETVGIDTPEDIDKAIQFLNQ